MKAIMCFLAVLNMAWVSLGDVVYLKGGGKFEGRITEHEDKIELEMVKGKMVIAQSQILRIEKERHILDDNDERVAKASEDDAQAQLKLARWCKLNGLEAQAKKHYKLAHLVDEKNEEALKALGLDAKPEEPAGAEKGETDKTHEVREPETQPGKKEGLAFDRDAVEKAGPARKPTRTALDESFKKLRLYASEKDVLASFGEPERRQTYDTGQIGLFYSSQGLQIYIDNRGVYAFNINSPNWPLKSGIRFGDPLKNVFRAYGMYRKKIMGNLKQIPDENPTLICDSESGDVAVKYDTGYCFWAHASGQISGIRVTLETLKAPTQGNSPQPQPVAVSRNPQLWTWEDVTGETPLPDSISTQKSLADLARFKEIVEQAYCGYDYFAQQGHDWEKMFTELRAAVEKRESWTPAELARLFADALRFTGDRHFIFKIRARRGGKSIQVGRHKDAYFADIVVTRVDGKLKVVPTSPEVLGAGVWFLASCDGHDPQQNLFRTLDPRQGGDAYLMGVLSEDPVQELKVRLRSAGGTEREFNLPLHRGRMGDHKPDHSSIFTYRAEPFPILQVTTFDIRNAVPAVRQKLEEFQASASRPEVRNSRHVLVDVRGNGGGQDISGPAWLDMLTNEPIKTCVVDTLRSPLIYEALLNGELYRHYRPGGGTQASFEALRAAFLRGEKVPSNVTGYAVNQRRVDKHESSVWQSTKAPSRFGGTLLILHDGGTGSAAEDFIQMARQFEHAVTLGENSEGMRNFGDCLNYDLPNSKIKFQCGNKLIRDERGEMQEGKGFLPDYWFDEADPLDSILKNARRLQPHPGERSEK